MCLFGFNTTRGLLLTIVMSTSSALVASDAEVGKVDGFQFEYDAVATNSIAYEAFARTDAQVSAARFVRQAGLYRGLSLMLLDEAKTDPLVLTAIEQQGFNAVEKKVVSLIREVTGKHRLSWEVLLAGHYAQNFPADVLASVVSKGEGSPWFNQFIAGQKTLETQQVLANSHEFKLAQGDLRARLKIALTG